jgi:hypothetical protein
VRQAWNALWLTLAFLAELAALAALAYWGATVPRSGALRVVVGVGAPLVAALLWGTFAAPRALVHVPVLAILVKIVVFGCAVFALVATGHPWLGATLAVVAMLSALLSTPPAVGELSRPPTG